MQPPGLLPALVLVGCYGGCVWQKPGRVCGGLPHRGTIPRLSRGEAWSSTSNPGPVKFTYVSECCSRVDGRGHNKASGWSRSAHVRAAESSPRGNSRWPLTEGNWRRHQRSSSPDGTDDRVRATRGSELHVARMTKARHLSLWGADARGCPKPGGGGSPHLCRPAHDQRSRLPAGQRPRTTHRRSACTIAPPHTSLPDAVGVSAPATPPDSPNHRRRRRIGPQRQPVIVEPHFT
jgi:hypothetical protein